MISPLLVDVIASPTLITLQSALRARNDIKFSSSLHRRSSRFRHHRNRNR
jgi:hypothetical protein